MVDYGVKYLKLNLIPQRRIEMYTYLTYRRNSLIGRIYFWYFDQVGDWGIPVHEDSCHVRRTVLTDAPWYWLRKHKLFGTRVRPWMFVAVAMWALFAKILPGEAANVVIIIVAVVAFCIAGILAFVVAIIIFGSLAELREKAIKNSRTLGSRSIIGHWYKDIKQRICRPIKWE